MREKIVFRCLLISMLVLGSGLLEKAHAIISPTEIAALKALYIATNGDNWTDNSGWKTPPLGNDGFALPGTEGSWEGVTLNDTEEAVEHIHLGNNNLVGTIPPEIGDFASLEYLNLDDNQLASLPDDLGDLTNLQNLYIQNSQLTGTIPSSLGNLTNLVTLSLEGNDLSGGIPDTLQNLTSLTWLSLAFNELTGHIPSWLTFTQLDRLDLQVNQFDGSIPSTLGSLTNLTQLYLYQNQLTGNIPMELGNLTNLEKLDLENNQLSGNIPSSLGNLDTLERLSLHNNQLDGNIPSELGNMDSLDRLLLYRNQLTGSIPENLRNLTTLGGLDLGSNQLTGNIPSWLDELTNLTHLQLNDNQLDGSIPSEPFEPGDLPNLYELDFSGNQLTGGILGALGNLSGLNYLYLDNNKFTGSIPPALGSLTELRRLYLNGNNLSGSIPTSLMNLTNIGGYLDLGYNALYTDDPDLLDFLGDADWNWARTQTISPEGVAAMTLTATSVEVSYTPIEYDFDPGGYVVCYDTAPGEPYPFSMTTANKEVGEAEVTGLEPGNTYYFVVQTRTDPHIDPEPEFSNQNTVLSEYSDEVSAETPLWADLSVTKAGSSDPITAGQELTYTVTVQNGGPSDAVNATLTDTPAHLESPEYSTDSGQTWIAWTGSLNLGTIVSAGSEEVLIRGAVTSSATDSVSNTASVSSDIIDPEMANNSATQETSVGTKADLLAILEDSPNPVLAGEPLTYTITVENQGPSDAVACSVVDTLAFQLESPQYSTDGGNEWNDWSGSLNIGTVEALSSPQVLIRGTAPSSQTEAIVNVATVRSDTPDNDKGNNTDTVETAVQTEADLVLTKADSADPMTAGEVLTYTITVDNQGPSDAAGVTLSDTVPQELSGPEYSTDGGETWGSWISPLAIGTIGASSSQQVLIRGTIDPSFIGQISNTATASSNTTDPDTENNSATEGTTIEAKADLAVTKADSTDPILAGHELTYTITVENLGPSDAVSAALTDDVPSQLENPQYSTDNGQNWSDWTGSLVLGTMSPDSSHEILIRATSAPGFRGLISNTASVGSDTTEIDMENNSDTEETTAIIIGDIDGDGKVDLTDAILLCRILCGMALDYNPPHVPFDLNGDGKFSWAELLYILQTVSELRQ